MKALLLLAVLAGAWCVSANTVSGPLADLLDSDEQELSPSAAAVLETTADALSPADQETLASMLHDSEGIELVGSNGSGLDEELTAESEALEDAAQEEVAAAEEDAAVVEASEGTEVTDESNAIITEEGSAEEESQDEAEEMMALIALSEEDESDDEEEETADDMSESPAFIEFADEHPIMSKAEADASTILLHIAEDAYSFLDLAEQVSLDSEDEDEEESDEEAEDEEESDEEAEEESEEEDSEEGEADAESEDEDEGEADDEAEFESEEESFDFESVSDSDPYVSFAEVMVSAPLEAVTTTAETDEQVEAAAEAAEEEDAAAEAQTTESTETETETDSSDVSEEMVINADGEGIWQDVQRDVAKPSTLESASWDAIQHDTAVIPEAPKLIPASFQKEGAAPAAVAPTPTSAVAVKVKPLTTSEHPQIPRPA